MNMPRPRFIIVMLLTTLLSLLSILPFAYGQGVPDQVNDPQPVSGPDPDYWYEASETDILMQSFTPTAEELWAVELRLGNTRVDRATVVVTVDIREGTWDGPILGTASVSVPYTYIPGDPWPPHTLVRFDFDPPIATTPGSTYVIQAVAPSDPDLRGVAWVCRVDDPYPGGIALIVIERSDMDFRFITYGPEITPPIPEFEASIVIMVSVAMMSLFLFKRLPLLIRRP